MNAKDIWGAQRMLKQLSSQTPDLQISEEEVKALYPPSNETDLKEQNKKTNQ